MQANFTKALNLLISLVVKVLKETVQTPKTQSLHVLQLIKLAHSSRQRLQLLAVIVCAKVK